MEPTTVNSLTDIAILGIVAGASIKLARLYVFAIGRRPRLCSCSHGPGHHGGETGGCTGREVTGGRIYDCRCTGFDAAGPRAPR